MPVEIPLTGGLVALVDEEDAPLVLRFTWCASKVRNTYYARAQIYGDNTRMHALILGRPPKGMVTDHINWNGLDNRRGNLRMVTRSVNSIHRRVSANSLSGVVGVNLWAARKSRRQWLATIQKDGIHHHLGWFLTKEEAVHARREAERNLGVEGSA